MFSIQGIHHLEFSLAAESPAAFAGGVAAAPPDQDNADKNVLSKTSPGGGEDEARTYFPETWLWDLNLLE